MITRPSAWATVALARAAPGVVAILGVGSESSPETLAIATHALGLSAIVVIVLSVYASAMFCEGYAIEHPSFRQISWITPRIAMALTAFFVVVFGLLAYWALAGGGAQGFGIGIAAAR